MKRIPIGVSDFRELIESDYYYVDTTNMIGEIYREPSKITLITRPRRFGKTLNMSMLRYFFDNQMDSHTLFEAFTISKDKEIMREINGYPVIYLTFKNINDSTWGDCEAHLHNLFSEIFKEKESELKSLLADKDIEFYFRKIVRKTANKVEYKDALKNLTEYLYKIYNKPVFLIVDEYDVPIQYGWSNGYYEEIIDFMKGTLSGVLKDNSCLFKGVLTGIYRVAKESIFSGLNNLKVFSLLKEKYSEYFGFTEEEIEKLLIAMNKDSDNEFRQNLKEWYDGYQFGGKTIYNPWSVMNYFSDSELKPYWINTSSNDLIKSLIENNLKDDQDFRKAIESLIAGESIEKTIDSPAALRDIEFSKKAIWALFLFSGYLKPESQILNRGKYDCRLKIPNEEVLIFFQDTIIEWLERGSGTSISNITRPLLKGDAELFCNNLKNYVRNTLRYYWSFKETPGSFENKTPDLQGEPENSYHLILLGMFSHLSNNYWILSNRESGEGRYDICLKAKDKKHFSAIIEVKASSEKVDDALKQIVDKDYTRELENEGYTNIIRLAIGVDGKDVETVCFW